MPISRGQLILVHTKFGWKQAKCCEIYTGQIKAQLTDSTKSYTFNRCNVREISSSESSSSSITRSTNIVVNQTVNFRQATAKRQNLSERANSSTNCIGNIRTVTPSLLPVFLFASACILLFRAVRWICEVAELVFGKVIEQCHRS